MCLIITAILTRIVRYPDQILDILIKTFEPFPIDTIRLSDFPNHVCIDICDILTYFRMNHETHDSFSHEMNKPIHSDRYVLPQNEISRIAKHFSNNNQIVVHIVLL